MKQGALDEVERYSIENQQWIRINTMNQKRINASACPVGDNHLYVFGGRNDLEIFYDSIERYNDKLDMWNQLKIRIP